MATATDAARVLQKIGAQQAETIARAPTGIEPGYDPNTGIAWTEDGRGRYRSTGGVGVWVVSTVPQTVANTTLVNADFDLQLYDTSAFWDAGTPDRITFPVDGAYAASYRVEFDDGTTGFRSTYFIMNAAPYAQLTLPPSPGVNGSTHSSSDIIQAEAGDELILKVEHSEGTSLDLIEVQMKAYRIGPRIPLL